MKKTIINNQAYDISDSLVNFKIHADPSSKNINYLGLCPAEKTAFVEFKNGRQYLYKDVPEETFASFDPSESLGKFVQAKLVNGGMPFEQIKRAIISKSMPK